MKVLIAVDPGTYESGIVIIKPGTFEILESFKIENNLGIIALEFQKYYDKGDPDPGNVVIEKLQPQGKRVGTETFETIYFSGQLHNMVENKFPKWKVIRIGRKAVLAHHDSLYMTMSNDARIRKILIERFGKEFTKKLFLDTWAAFAVAVCFLDKKKGKK